MPDSSSSLTLVICEIAILRSCTWKYLKSMWNSSSIERSRRRELERNISAAYSLMFRPAIFASSSAAMRSSGVQVGERNISVSDRIAEHSRPAIFGSISMFFS